MLSTAAEWGVSPNKVSLHAEALPAGAFPHPGAWKMRVQQREVGSETEREPRGSDAQSGTKRRKLSAVLKLLRAAARENVTTDPGSGNVELLGSSGAERTHLRRDSRETWRRGPGDGFSRSSSAEGREGVASTLLREMVTRAPGHSCLAVPGGLDLH